MEEITFEEIVEQAFVEAKALIEKQSRYSYPFRDRFEHTLRVLKWAKRIHESEGGDIEVITLAVIFHDTGWDDQEDHAVIGAELARKYLINQGISPEIINRVVSAVETHNKRQNPRANLPIENLIVMDADRLDELGVTTLVWDSMTTAIQEKPSFKKALERSQMFFAGAKEGINLIHTQTGRKFYCERVEIWEKSLAHLRYELGESDVIDI
jgi:uncharacterized protein